MKAICDDCAAPMSEPAGTCAACGKQLCHACFIGVHECRHGIMAEPTIAFEECCGDPRCDCAKYGSLRSAHPGTVSRWENDVKEPDRWQRDIMETLQVMIRRYPERADLAKGFITAGTPSCALGVLLAPGGDSK